MSLENIPTQEDLDALVEYGHGKAKDYFGMSFADGIMAVVDWLEGNGERPDKDEE